MGLFVNAHEWGPKSPLHLQIICFTYRIMMKFGTVLPYLKKVQKHINQVTRPVIPADIRISSLCYVRKYK